MSPTFFLPVEFYILEYWHSFLPYRLLDLLQNLVLPPSFCVFQWSREVVTDPSSMASPSDVYVVIPTVQIAN